MCFGEPVSAPGGRAGLTPEARGVARACSHSVQRVASNAAVYRGALTFAANNIDNKFSQC